MTAEIVKKDGFYMLNGIEWGGCFRYSFSLYCGDVIRFIGVNVRPARSAGVSLRLITDGRVLYEIDRECARALEKITTGKNKRGWFFLHDIHADLRRAHSCNLELEFSDLRWLAKVQIVTGRHR